MGHSMVRRDTSWYDIVRRDAHVVVTSSTTARENMLTVEVIHNGQMSWRERRLGCDAVSVGMKTSYLSPSLLPVTS